jgi:hypothetical protein
MAQVLLCRADGIEGFRKVVAVKRILPHFARDPEFIRMFLDEARLAAHLDHPNVVQVHDIGRAGADYFFAMEYVHGESLLALLREAAAAGEELALRHAVFIATEVLAGLHHAHERIGFDGDGLGLIHRDVSPSNVLVSYEGAVKVADFGIAKAAQSNAESTAGVRKGKVPYMAPEQCLGHDLDPRADVWSLGVVLYEMTTGMRPFRGPTEFALMEEIVHGRPLPPPQHVPDYPAPLQTVVMRALMRDRNDRFASARVFRQELLGVARSLGLHSSTEELGATMRELFGPKPLPWAGDGVDEEPPTRLPAEIEPPATVVAPADAGRRRRRIAIAAAAAGVVALVATALAWPEDDAPIADAPSPAAAATPPERLPAAAAPVSAPRPEPSPPPEVAPAPAPVPAATEAADEASNHATPAPKTRKRSRPKPTRRTDDAPAAKPGLFDEFLVESKPKD